MSVKECEIKIQDIEMSKKVDLETEYIEYTLELKKGETHHQTCFTLDKAVEIGAYYITIEKI